jgi:hypothetical protein
MALLILNGALGKHYSHRIFVKGMERKTSRGAKSAIESIPSQPTLYSSLSKLLADNTPSEAIGLISKNEI